MLSLMKSIRILHRPRRITLMVWKHTQSHPSNPFIEEDSDTISNVDTVRKYQSPVKTGKTGLDIVR